MAKWFGAHYNQEVRFRSALKCKKGPQVLTPLLNHRRNYYYYINATGPKPYLTAAPMSNQMTNLKYFKKHNYGSENYDLNKRRKVIGQN